MIVIDIGCGRYGGDYSIERLLDEFQPDVLYGFDPNPKGLSDAAFALGDLPSTAVFLDSRVAWTYDGEIGFRADGLNSWVTDAADAPRVECFDLAAFVKSLPEKHGEGVEIVLKMDVETSEYELLRHLIDTDTDAFLKLAWVEWHMNGVPDAAARRQAIEEEIRCELAEWRW